MKIYFERTGGFAGIRTSASLDTDKLPPNESEQLNNMCNNMNFFNLPSKFESKSGAADLFRYKITIESKNGKHTVETTDMSMTPEFENLVNFLSDKALKK
ncbi:MAG TPA: protealysin inhibitor emfourin [Candidatus Nitrosotalea sp.]|nr:protealysin inhibitor emfourin [Candidatus Nitrosotalea sp.]